MPKFFADNGKKRGRPVSTGTGTLIGVRFTDDKLAELDRWIAEQGDTPTRPEAIRRLAEIGFEASKRVPPKLTSKATADRAAELATSVIESRLAADATAEEREVRKRRLVKGPSSFQGVRRDHPKKRP